MQWVLFAVAVAAALLQPTPAPAPSAEAAAAPVVVPLELLGGRPVVALTINGAGPFRFLIDPSASTSHVDIALIEELRLRPPGARSKAGRNTSDPRVVEIAFGRITVSRVEMRPIDMASIVPEFGPATRPRGIVAGSAWGSRLLTIDYPSWRLALATGSLPAANGKDIFSLDGASSDLSPTVTIAGRSIRCDIDLLSTAGLLLPESLATTLPLVKAPVETGVTQTRGGPRAVREAQLAGDAALGARLFVRPVLQFSAGATLPIVGAAWLGDFALVFDLANRRVRLAPRR